MFAGDEFAGVNPTDLLGLLPGSARTDGAGLPRSTTTSALRDRAGLPWHPDSGAFWLAGLAFLTLTGIVGASVRVHAGPVRAGGSIGKD